MNHGENNNVFSWILLISYVHNEHHDAFLFLLCCLNRQNDRVMIGTMLFSSRVDVSDVRNVENNALLEYVVA